MVQKNKKVSILFSVLFSVCLVWPFGGQAASLYLAPQSQTIYQGDSFLTELRIDTEGEEINAVEAYLTFPSNLLEAIDFSKGDSILKFFVKKPEFKNGKISFAGGTPNGFKGDGLLAKIIFSAEALGKAKIAFENNSKILLNDGEGSLAQSNFLQGEYEILKQPEGLPGISSESHPDQNKWYNNNILSLYWDLVEGAEYSWILSRDPQAEPDEISDEPEPKEGVAFWMGAMEYDFKEQGDGIYYFLLRESREREWGPKVSFRAMIDTAAPEEFEPKITEIEGKNYLVFAADDKTSGIEHYEIREIPRIWTLKIAKKGWKVGESPYLLEDQSLRSKILVKTIDKAGNKRIAEITPPYKATWKDMAILLLILIGLAIIWQVIKSRNRQQNVKLA
ncbi:hypothetical protein KAS79_03865 [Candidatus Parcubacteria bacterium]|nr:hypothetical protein [Candidatus Parcubacteria bacterium]